MDADATAAREWAAATNQIGASTLFGSAACSSWYLGSNVPGKPRSFLPFIGFNSYCEKCDEVAAKGYEGFALA